MCAAPRRILYTGLDPLSYQDKGCVTHCPLIQIVPRPLAVVQQALQAFAAYTHVIVTSKSSVSILADYLPQLGMSLAAWQAKTTLAVGRVTAAHLQRCGIQAAVVAQEETAEGLTKELEKLSLQDAFIFWPHSAQARPVLIEYFQQRELAYCACALYDTEMLQPSPLPSLEIFDEIVFTSPSTVQAFWQLFGTFPVDKTLTCIGPITEKCLRDYLKIFSLSL